MIYIGIDPGLTGGIAVLDDGHWRAKTWKMPETRRAQYALLDDLTADTLHAIVIEHVHAMPGRGGHVGNWTFAEHYGGLLMALDSLQLEYEQVVPRRWQRAMRCESGGDKRITKRRAEILFPSLSVTHRTADALLLATFCRSIHTVRIPRTSHVARAGAVHGKNAEEEGREEAGQGRQVPRRRRA